MTIVEFQTDELCLELTRLLCSVQVPPVHPVFVVILRGVQVSVQTPLLLSEGKHGTDTRVIRGSTV